MSKHLIVFSGDLFLERKFSEPYQEGKTNGGGKKVIITLIPGDNI